MIDTHTHFMNNKFDLDREDVITKAVNAGVSKFVEIGCDEASSIAVFGFVKDRDNFVCSIGIHPHDASTINDSIINKFKILAKSEKVAAIGEIGLDYYRNLSPQNIQFVAFQRQLELAKELQKPVVIHCRDAHEDTQKILSDYFVDVDLESDYKINGVLHSFSGDISDAEFYIKKGFVLGISGPITYKNNLNLKYVVKKIDLKYFLLETDCPYLPPVPYRGQRNDSSYLDLIALEIANLKCINKSVVYFNTSQTAEKIFFL